MNFLFESKFNLFDVMSWLVIWALTDIISIWFLFAYIPAIVFSVYMQQRIEGKA